MRYRPEQHPEHRPWPTPRGLPWVMRMRWHDLLFMHWPVEPAALRALIPPTLQLDTFDGQAWLGVVPFHMSGIRPRLLPPVPGLHAFPEINLRTYVTAEDKPGVWFFSLDATSRVAVRGARWTFHLPYFDASIACQVNAERTEVRYRNERTHRGAPPAAFEATYGPTGAAFNAVAGTLDHFLTERYCLYAARPDGRTYRGEIAHPPWPLQPAAADVRTLRMTEQVGVALPDVPPLLHFAADQDVVAWPPYRVGNSP